jgi:hypothetical protein
MDRKVCVLGFFWGGGVKFSEWSEKFGEARFQTIKETQTIRNSALS